MPIFTGIALLTLSIAIGVNTAVFSLLYQIQFVPLAVEEPKQLVRLWETSPEGASEIPVSPANIVDWTRQSNTLLDSATWIHAAARLDGTSVEIVEGQMVSPNFFEVLGVRPALGSGFQIADGRYGAPLVVMISDRLFTRRYGRDASIVGQSIPVNGRDALVVGVMAADAFTMGSPHCDVWLPLRFHPKRKDRTHVGRYLNVVARLAPGVSIQTAQLEFNGIARQLEQKYPRFNARWGVRAVALQESLTGALQQPLRWGASAGFAMLLLACAALVKWYLKRQSRRSRELALRVLLGSRRLHFFQLFAAEGLVLGLGGAVFGLALARRLVAEVCVFVPQMDSMRCDSIFIGIALGLGILCAVPFSVVPAMSIRLETRGNSRLR
ncbi:ABC transporter permease [Bryobacter aggregatus]|uniref:ABC transporter permease n=1 Tax=Bryobacter aggregatus TaxID=360054 RepID=UPI0004E13693|nr:ABC transporter permease [Bryobacter aggregatus]